MGNRVVALLLVLLLARCGSSRPGPESASGSEDAAGPAAGDAAGATALEPRRLPVNEWPEEECLACHDVRFVLRGEELVACQACLGSPAALVERLAAIGELAELVRDCGEREGTMRCPFCQAGLVSFEVGEEQRLAATCATPGCVMVTEWFLPAAAAGEE